MPNKVNNDDQFVDAVKPALESLLSDLQRTTEVLRRANDRGGGQNDRSTSLTTTTTTTKTTNRNNYSNKRNGYDNQDDIDPIYQEQNFSTTTKIAPLRDVSDVREADLSNRNSSRNELRSSSAQPNGQSNSHLDSMLGNLQVDMDKHGIHTIPKGDCASCGKAIIGQVVIALGKMWHPEHYVCCHCGEEIGHQNFFERGGKAYCENDYHDLFSPRCAYCNGPIRDRCVTALGKTYHTEHFVCSECGRPFGDDGFHEKDGFAYCKNDFYRIYAPKCQGCKQPIKNKFITALSTHWHPECFTCQADDHFSKLCPLHVSYFEEDEEYY